jgi:hypothetical protein
MGVTAKHHARKTYGGVEMELRPLYTAGKKRYISVISRSYAGPIFGLDVVALTAVKLLSFSP